MYNVVLVITADKRLRILLNILKLYYGFENEN